MLFDVATNKAFHDACLCVDECLDMIQAIFCLRCAKEQNIITKSHHHYGRIYTCLLGNTTSDQINTWMLDLEHGLFHGLSTAIVASMLIRKDFPHIKELLTLGGEQLYIKEKNLESRKMPEVNVDPATYSNYRRNGKPFSFEELVASCLLHDFARCQFGVDRHDDKCKELFPNLQPEAYSHFSAPDHQSICVMADVLELRRFTNYLEWYKPFVVESQLDRATLRMLDFYFVCIRPAMEHIFRHRNSLWIRHGPEIPQVLSTNQYPQHPNQWMPIEIDRLPFTHCFNHDYHISAAPWGVIRGMLDYERFRSLKGTSQPHKEFYRDHLFAQLDAKFEDWCFVWDRRSPPCNQKWIYDFGNQLITNKQKILHLSIVNKLHHIISLISDVIMLVN